MFLVDVDSGAFRQLDGTWAQDYSFARVATEGGMGPRKFVSRLNRDRVLFASAGTKRSFAHGEQPNVPPRVAIRVAIFTIAPRAGTGCPGIRRRAAHFYLGAWRHLVRARPAPAEKGLISRDLS